MFLFFFPTLSCRGRDCSLKERSRAWVISDEDLCGCVRSVMVLFSKLRMFFDSYHSCANMRKDVRVRVTFFFYDSSVITKHCYYQELSYTNKGLSVYMCLQLNTLSYEGRKVFFRNTHFFLYVSTLIYIKMQKQLH